MLNQKRTETLMLSWEASKIILKKYKQTFVYLEKTLLFLFFYFGSYHIKKRTELIVTIVKKTFTFLCENMYNGAFRMFAITSEITLAGKVVVAVCIPGSVFIRYTTKCIFNLPDSENRRLIVFVLKVSDRS